jgi:hypothetical protein
MSRQNKIISYACQILIKSNFLCISSKNIEMLNFKKICPVGAELFHTDGRARMTMLTVTFRNFANAPKNTIVRTNISLSIYVQFSQFRSCSVDSCYRQPPQSDYFLQSRPRPFDSQQKHISAIGPATTYRTHCWPHRVRRRNICAEHRTLQYSSGPCRNIQRR